MAGYKYFTVLTDVGKQKLVEAIANETALDFTEMAVGDSNGTSYDPTPDMIALKHETYRATISSLSIDEVDRNIMIFQLVVPSSSGGYYIREAGLFSSDGSLIAIARTAEQYKPQLSEGAGASIDINMRIAISSEAQIYINVPESITYATKTYVTEEFKKHTQKEDPHQQYMLETYANEIFAIKEHNHELSSLNGVLPVNKGGTGGTNINDARKNLQTFRQSMFKEGADLNNISLYTKEMTIKHFNNNLLNRPSDLAQTGDYVTVLNLSHKRGWQRFYESGVSANGSFRVAGRLYSNNVWGEWKILRNVDGSIPADLLPVKAPTHYTTSAGTWVETTLSDGKIRLEGWGRVSKSETNNHTVYLPKKVSEGKVILSPVYFGIGFIYGTQNSIVLSSNPYFEIIFSDPAGIGDKIIMADWYITAILA